MQHSVDIDLMCVRAYPEPVTSIKLVQTHISYVFVTDRAVYKVKKPVNFGFLDFTTLDSRRHFCEREVELNRRMAPDIYEGVVPVTEREDGWLVLGGDGPVRDYAVRMKPIAMELLMKNLLLAGDLGEADVARVGRAIASFHAGARRSPEIDSFGLAGSFRVNTDENFEQTRCFIGRTIEKAAYDALVSYTDIFYTVHKDLFPKRIADGRIRDCHGDLHMEHVVLTDPVAAFDCIEFNDRFRYSDTAADIAFLAMDLDFHGRRDLSDALVLAYVDGTGDVGVLDVLNFYKVYRAYVRGKVLSFKLDDAHISEGEKEEARSSARAYFELALSYVRG